MPSVFKYCAAGTACSVVCAYQVSAQLLYMLIKPQDKLSKYSALRHTASGQFCVTGACVAGAYVTGICAKGACVAGAYVTGICAKGAWLMPN